MKAFYCDRFPLPLPATHRFPLEKYNKLRARVDAELPEIDLHEPDAASSDLLELVHDAAYVRRVCDGGLSAIEQRSIGFPWSREMVERSRRSVGATIAACRAAQSDGVALNLAGGTHHAFGDHGQGYCVFNDAAVAARSMQFEAARTGDLLRVAIVDLDVHQGDGTAAIFRRDDSVFTVSLHGETNFPFRKETSDIDVALPAGTADPVYLAALDEAVEQLERRFAPQLLIYLAGADAHEADRLGKLKLTKAGMGTRDARVFDLAHRLRVPIAVAMAGGYGHDIDVTVDIHLQTVRAALAHAGRIERDARKEPHGV